jgi:hypothetical protein
VQKASLICRSVCHTGKDLGYLKGKFNIIDVQGNRFTLTRFLSLLPVRVYASDIPLNRIPLNHEPRCFSPSPFLTQLSTTCRDILAKEQMEHKRSVTEARRTRAVPMKVNSRLTSHTVQSLLWGAQLGYTTLTANRTSVRAILKEMVTRTKGVLNDNGNIRSDHTAAIWLVDPRSLAEGLRT